MLGSLLSQHSKAFAIDDKSEWSNASLVIPHGGTQEERDVVLARKFQRLWKVCFVGAVTLVFVYVSVTFVLELVIVGNNTLTIAAGDDTSKSSHADESETTIKEDLSWGISDTVIFTRLSNEQFTVFVTFLVWATAGTYNSCQCISCLRRLNTISQT